MRQENIMAQKSDPFAGLKQVAEAIATMFGRNCEVAIHDLTNLDRSLIHITGNVTGRGIGAPATDLLIRELHNSQEEVIDIRNYKTTTRDGRVIKSTTVFLRNTRGDVFAAFCINLDTTDLLNASQTLAAFVNTMDDGQNVSQETFACSSAETIEAIFKQSVEEIGKQPATMSFTERFQLVSLLQDKGVFNMKGAVNLIAELTGVSKHTIYHYLKKQRNSEILGKTDEKKDTNR